MEMTEIFKNGYELEHVNSYFNRVKSNWIEVVTVHGRLELLNLDNFREICLGNKKIVFYNREENYVEVQFDDNKYDSLVDFINSKKVNL